MKKKVPRLKSDKEAEAFLAQDLSRLDFSQCKPARFEFKKKDEQINMRVPKPLLAAVKARGIPYTHFIRETLERAIAAQSKLVTARPGGMASWRRRLRNFAWVGRADSMGLREAGSEPKCP